MIARIWPENHDSASNQGIAFTATVPDLFPNSLNATAAVPFFEWKWTPNSMSRLDGKSGVANPKPEKWT
jgi:hypothetical protein